MGSTIRIQAVKKRAFLNQIAAGAVSTSSTLTAALTQIQAQVFSPSFKSGRFIISQSGAGQSGSYQMSIAGAEWTQDNIFGLTQELIELIPVTIANLAQSNVTIADDTTQTATLTAAMMQDDSLYGVTEQHGDFTTLRYPVTR